MYILDQYTFRLISLCPLFAFILAVAKFRVVCQQDRRSSHSSVPTAHPPLYPSNLFPFSTTERTTAFPTAIMSSIPRKEIHAAATNPSERGFPTHGNPAPDDQDAWSAPNNPATKNPAEEHPEWEGKTLDGRGAGTTGGRAKEEMKTLRMREG